MQIHTFNINYTLKHINASWTTMQGERRHMVLLRVLQATGKQVEKKYTSSSLTEVICKGIHAKMVPILRQKSTALGG